MTANIRKIARFVGDTLRNKLKIKRKRRRDTLDQKSDRADT